MEIDPWHPGHDRRDKIFVCQGARTASGTTSPQLSLLESNRMTSRSVLNQSLLEAGFVPRIRSFGTGGNRTISSWCRLESPSR